MPTGILADNGDRLFLRHANQAGIAAAKIPKAGVRQVAVVPIRPIDQRVGADSAEIDPLFDCLVDLAQEHPPPPRA